MFVCLFSVVVVVVVVVLVVVVRQCCLSSWLCFVVVVVFVAVFAVVVKVTDAPLVPGTREGHASFLDTLPLLGLGNHARRSGYKTTAYCNRRSLFIFS